MLNLLEVGTPSCRIVKGEKVVEAEIAQVLKSKEFIFHSSIFQLILKFMFSKKATKINEIFTVDLTITT